MILSRKSRAAIPRRARDNTIRPRLKATAVTMTEVSAELRSRRIIGTDRRTNPEHKTAAPRKKSKMTYHFNQEDIS